MLIVFAVYRCIFFFISRHLGRWNRAYTKCFIFFRMEECLHLVCESMGVHEDDEVGVDMIWSLYKSVFLITASLDETKRAIAQVNKMFCGLRISWMRRERQKRSRKRNVLCDVFRSEVRVEVCHVHPEEFCMFSSWWRNNVRTEKRSFFNYVYISLLFLSVFFLIYTK